MRSSSEFDIALQEAFQIINDAAKRAADIMIAAQIAEMTQVDAQPRDLGRAPGRQHGDVDGEGNPMTPTQA